MGHEIHVVVLAVAIPLHVGLDIFPCPLLVFSKDIQYFQSLLSTTMWSMNTVSTSESKGVF